MFFIFSEQRKYAFYLLVARGVSSEKVEDATRKLLLNFCTSNRSRMWLKKHRKKRLQTEDLGKLS